MSDKKHFLISELVERGLRCPQCGGIKIRGGYHDFQHMDSFICEDCGIHWNEDFNDFGQAWRFEERGFVWVLCDSKYPLIPILNPDTADEDASRESFVSRGIAWGRNER